MNRGRELAESYLNGNISYVRGELKRAHKVTVLEFARHVSMLSPSTGTPRNGVNVALQLLR